tara:strand:- start:11653 stop:12375 length:723 start_codon:yes stop_codon:yes gene_type:complete
MGNSRIFNIDAFKSQISQGLARSNKFVIGLPAGSTIENDHNRFQTNPSNEPRITAVASDLPGRSTLHFLCRSCNLPMNQMLTSERIIGMKQEKITYGYAQSDVTLSFYESNDFPIRKYFQTWQNTQVDQDEGELNFKKSYAKDMTITAFSTEGSPLFGVSLIDAFPVTINQQDFSNENNGIVDTTVTIAYTRYLSQIPSGMKNVAGGLPDGIDQFVKDARDARELKKLKSVWLDPFRNIG